MRVVECKVVWWGCEKGPETAVHEMNRESSFGGTLAGQERHSEANNLQHELMEQGLVLLDSIEAVVMGINDEGGVK